MFEFEVFRKQMYCTEESTCDTVWTLWRPRSHSALPVVIRCPENCASPRYAPATVQMSAGFVRFWKKWNSCCGKRRHRFWIFDQNSKTACLNYSLKLTLPVPPCITFIYRLCSKCQNCSFCDSLCSNYFLGPFMFSFSLYQKTFRKLRVLIKGRTSTC